MSVMALVVMHMGNLLRLDPEQDTTVLKCSHFRKDEDLVIATECQRHLDFREGVAEVNWVVFGVIGAGMEVIESPTTRVAARH